MNADKTQPRFVLFLIPVLILTVVIGAIALTVGLGNPLGRAIGRKPWVEAKTAGRVTVASTVDDRDNAVLATWGEEYLAGLDALLGIEAGPVRVNLLRDKREYIEYCSAYVPGFNRDMQFCYSRRRRAVYGYHQALFRLKPLLRHEMFHAVAHARLPDLALWLDEGIAEYLEDCESVDGRLVHVDVQGGWLRMAYQARRDPERSPHLLPQVGERLFYSRRGRIWYALAYSTTLYLAKSGLLADCITGEKIALPAAGYADYIASGDWDELPAADTIRGGATWTLRTRTVD